MSARDLILGRLRATAITHKPELPDVTGWFATHRRHEDQDQRIARLRTALDMAKRMQAEQDSTIRQLRDRLAESGKQRSALAVFAQIAFDRLSPDKRQGVLLECAKYAAQWTEMPF